MSAIQRGVFLLDGSEWEKVSKEGKKLVERMFTYNPGKNQNNLKYLTSLKTYSPQMFGGLMV